MEVGDLIPAGQLKHRVLIQNPEKTSDGLGGFTETWNTVCIRQAAIWPRRGMEKIINGKLVEESIWTVRILYYNELKTGMRVVVSNMDNTILEILSIAPFEMRRIYQDISCRKIE